jgi:hypothetical protein
MSPVSKAMVCGPHDFVTDRSSCFTEKDGENWPQRFALLCQISRRQREVVQIADLENVAIRALFWIGNDANNRRKPLRFLLQD